MSVYASIMQGLTEAGSCQQGKIRARKIKLAIKPVETFTTDDIKQIRQKTGLSQATFAGTPIEVFFNPIGDDAIKVFHAMGCRNGILAQLQP